MGSEVVRDVSGNLQALEAWRANPGSVPEESVVGWTIEQVLDRQVERVLEGLVVARLVRSHKRRLDSASPKELALDKKASRRVEHAHRNAWIMWTGQKFNAPVEPDVDHIVDDSERWAEAAQMNWDPWLRERIRVVREEAERTIAQANGSGPGLKTSRHLAGLFEFEARELNRVRLTLPHVRV